MFPNFELCFSFLFCVFLSFRVWWWLVVVAIFAREVNEAYVQSGTARVESGDEGTAVITPPAVHSFLCRVFTAITTAANRFTFFSLRRWLQVVRVRG